jgi:hypothetical protein
LITLSVEFFKLASKSPAARAV